MSLIDRIESEILGSLSNERCRLEAARENLAYYEGNFEEYRWRIPPDRYDDGHSHRSSYIFNLIVRTLTKDLYKNSPSRTFKNNPEATAFLDHVYKDQAMFAKWQAADRLSTAANVAAFQVAGSPDPLRPVKIHLWAADQFAVYVSPDDPLIPVAVVTIDCHDGSRRYTLWTKDEVRYYECKKQPSDFTSGGTAPKYVGKHPNPYKVKKPDGTFEGLIPFSFVHWDYPTTKFWTEGPGDLLTEINDNINTRLTQLGDQVRYIGAPIGFLSGVKPGYNLPRLLPGDFAKLEAPEEAFENQPEAKAWYLEPDLDFVTKAWEDIENLVNHTLETLGIPETAVRFVASVARSGESIKAEQLPLLMWAQSRQSSFAHYEADLAKLVLQVAVSHLSNHGVPSDHLQAALDDWQFTIRWQPLFTDGDARNREDDWDLANKLTSRVQIIMRRYNMSRDEAFAHLAQVEQDLKEEEAILGPLTLTSPPSTTGGDEESLSVDQTTEEGNIE